MSSTRSGWVTFSWIVLLLAGLVNSLYGVAALGRKEYFPADSVIYETLSSHGWIWLLLGVIQIVVSFAIAKRIQFGLFAGITLAVLAATMWFFYMLFLPEGGFALVLLYALVIYGLSAHMEEFAAT
jgi:hypothetical protein